MSWAGLKWARPAERRLTASAGTSGAQFCSLSPRIWPCFSFLGVHSGEEKGERRRYRRGAGDDGETKARQTDGLKGREREREMARQRKTEERENQSGKK